MKRKFTLIMTVAVVAVAAMLGFSSCDDDDYWNPYPLRRRL